MGGKDEQVQGTADKLKGKVKETAGEITNDEDLEAEGKADQLKGGAEKAWGKVKDAADDVKDAVKDVKN
jgi:uncharacterized protein YjbJ (UPF0337 family)